MAKGRGRQARSIQASGHSRYGGKRLAQKNKRDPLIIVSFILLFAFIAGLVAYQQKFHGNSVANYYANLAHHVRLRYAEVSQSVSRKKAAASPSDLDLQPKIQFEFYTALANAKMPELVANKPESEPKKLIAVRKSTAKPVLNPPKIVTEKNIEKDLEAFFKKG